MMATKARPAHAAEQRSQGAGPDIDLVVEAGFWPPEAELEALARRAVDATLAGIDLHGVDSELSLIFSDDAHVRALNATWRGKDKPTNVLSFPAFADAGRDRLPPMLGDIVLASQTVAAEAGAEGKPLAHHITHLIVHGVLHLIGYDHETDAEAQEMEEIERRVLAGLDIPDPY